MYERFTDRARRVLHIANVRARIHGEMCITPIYFFHAILLEGNGVAVAALGNLGANVIDLLRKTEAQLPPMIVEADSSIRLPQHYQTKQVIQYAIEEANNFNHHYVGTEHLLLGLLRLKYIADSMNQHGVTLEMVRAAVLQLRDPDYLAAKIKESAGRPAHVRVLPQTELIQPDSIREALALIQRIDWAALQRLCAIVQAATDKPVESLGNRPENIATPEHKKE